MKNFIRIFLIAGVAFCFTYGLTWLKDNKIPNFTGRVQFYVTDTTDVQDVLDLLLPDVKDTASLKRVFETKEVAQYLKPGYYVVDKGAVSVYAARMLNNGWQTPVRMTLSGNLRLRTEIAGKVARNLQLDSADVLAALSDKAFLAKYGATPATAFSLFLPDTYEVYWTASLDDVFSRMKGETDAFWTADNLDKAAALGLTRDQVTIVASIVCGETHHVPEMPKIAGVYLNRLKIGMLLQACPTVAYCYDYKLDRVLNRHLQVESRYNTYKYAGLPPGPICSPSREALLAVLNPDFGDGVTRAGGPGCNLYFCANADFSGTHAFARTLSQHNANAAAFQAELDRRAAAKRRNSGK